MELNETDEKNNLVADHTIEAIRKVHGRMRPFILVFPDETGRVSSITNITTVEAVSAILADYVNSLEGVDEMESFPTRIVQ